MTGSNWNPRTELHPRPQQALTEAHEWPSSAPQSFADIDVFTKQLRTMDDRLRIHWNPRAVKVPSQFTDASGKPVGFVNEGRWEVIVLADHTRSQSFRAYTLVCTVTEPVEIYQAGQKVHAMTDKGPYAPVGQWVVDFLKAADRHNVEQARQMSRTLDAVNAAQDAAKDAETRAGQQEAAERIYHDGTKEGGGVSELHPVRIKLVTSDTTSTEMAV